MKNTLFVAAIGAALILPACGTITPIPSTRKLTPEIMSQIAQTDVVLEANQQGVHAAWTSAGAAPAQTTYVYMPPGTSPLAAGIGVGIGQIIAIAILDAAPSARARRSVQKINTGLDKKALDEALMNKIRAASTDGSVKIGTVSAEEFERKAPTPQDKFKIITSYTLAEDASAIRVQAFVSYENDALTYSTPYTFAGKVPNTETKGPLYRNSFVYHSDRFVPPALTDEVRETLKVAIASQFEESTTEINASDYSDSKKAKKLSKLSSRRDKDIGLVADDKLSKSETAAMLIDKWRGSSSPALSKAIEDGQNFIAEMLIRDINDASIPKYETAEPKEKTGFFKLVQAGIGPLGNEDYSDAKPVVNGRRVVRLDSGYNAGAYHSFPEAGFATYGNTYKIAE